MITNTPILTIVLDGKEHMEDEALKKEAQIAIIAVEVE